MLARVGRPPTSTAPPSPYRASGPPPTCCFGCGAAASSVVVMPFEQIMPAVRDGAVDAGLVIHESRFTYPSYGLVCLQDLGTWWEAETGLPIPLGRDRGPPNP